MYANPRRPAHEVTQAFNDGFVIICTVRDAAAPGFQPVEELTPRLQLRYEEQRLGVQRYYEAKQNQVEISRVLRVPRAGVVTNQDAAITEDGRRYRIEMVQTVPDVLPLSLDITLSDYRQEDTR